MADGTSIEWTDATWNVVNGCSVTSPGCTNCYAMKLAGTRLRNDPSRSGLTINTKAGPAWTGEVRFNDKVLRDPLRWRRARKIFVCAHGDLFHDSVPDNWIDIVFAVMALCPQHTFQVLTKRSARMREYFADSKTEGRIVQDAMSLTPVGRDISGAGLMISGGKFCFAQWPLPNVWLGVSVEDQTRADERIPDLLAAPAAVRWISAEPLLGPLDLLSPFCIPHELLPNWATRDDNWGVSPLIGGLSPWIDPSQTCLDGGAGNVGHECNWAKIDWVVAGGESGPNARPMHPDWARSLRDQCAASGVAFHFKQWGASCPLRSDLVPVPRKDIGWVAKDGRYKFECSEDDHTPMYDDDDKFGPGYWSQTVRVGKKRAGRLLDGVEWNGYPG